MSVLNAAIEYAEHGFSVLPVVNKRPIIKFADMPPLTTDQLTKIYQQNPNAGVALKTDKFFVVDVDVGHSGGVDGFKTLESFGHDDWFPDTLCQRTGSGGVQMFYQKPTNKTVQQNIGWLAGVDVKAHNNNYVVVAPTEGYTWLNRRAIVQPVDELIDSINGGRDIYQKKSFKDKYLSMGDGPNKTTELFKTIAEGFGAKGNRNNNLASFVGGLLIRQVDADTVIKLTKIANQSSTDPLPERELDITVESMFKKEIRRRENDQQ